MDRIHAAQNRFRIHQPICGNRGLYSRNRGLYSRAHSDSPQSHSLLYSLVFHGVVIPLFIHSLLTCTSNTEFLEVVVATGLQNRTDLCAMPSREFTKSISIIDEFTQNRAAQVLQIARAQKWQPYHTLNSPCAAAKFTVC